MADHHDSITAMGPLTLRQEFTALGLSLATMLLITIVLLVATPLPMHYIIFPAVIGGLITGSVFTRRTRRRLRRELTESSTLLCPRCRYALRGSARQDGQCPECGFEYTRAQLERHWFEE